VFDTDTNEDTTERPEYYAGRLKGPLTIKKRRRLWGLFDEESNPGPIQIFTAWCGPEKLPTLTEAQEQVESGDISGFDPAEDNPASGSTVLLMEAYNLALDNGLDDEAAYLRALELSYQRGFARLLRLYLTRPWSR